MTSRHGSLTVSATSVQEHGEEGRAKLTLGASMVAPDISSEPAGAAQDRDDRSASVCRRDRPEAPGPHRRLYLLRLPHTSSGI